MIENSGFASVGAALQNVALIGKLAERDWLSVASLCAVLLEGVALTVENDRETEATLEVAVCFAQVPFGKGKRFHF